MNYNTDLLQKKIKSQKELSAVMVFHICFMQCKNMLVSTSSLYTYNNLINKLAMVIVFALYAMIIIKNGAKAGFLKAVVVIGIWWGISKLNDPRLFVDKTFPYRYVISQCSLFIAYSLPLFYASSMLETAEYLYEYFMKAARITFYVSVVSFLCYMFAPGGAVENNYSMSFGNQMLLGCTLLMFKYTKEHNKKDLFFFIITVFFIFASGSRGPLVSVFVLILYYQAVMKKTKNGMFVILIELALVGVCAVFYKEILQFVSDIMTSMGISSRTLELLLAGKISGDSGRSEYHARIFEALKSSPILGLGAFGGEKTSGLAHSLYIDIWANMGYVIGTVYMIVMATKIIKNVKTAPEAPRTQVILMMSIILFPRGFFDENFWASWQLWIIMGLLTGKKYESDWNARFKNENIANQQL